jgi:hypothetical protein
MQPIAIVDRDPEVNACAITIVEALTVIMKDESTQSEREVAGFVALAEVRRLTRMKQRKVETVCKLAA